MTYGNMWFVEPSNPRRKGKNLTRRHPKFNDWSHPDVYSAKEECRLWRSAELRSQKRKKQNTWPCFIRDLLRRNWSIDRKSSVATAGLQPPLILLKRQTGRRKLPSQNYWKNGNRWRRLLRNGEPPGNEILADTMDETMSNWPGLYTSSQGNRPWSKNNFSALTKSISIDGKHHVQCF